MKSPEPSELRRQLLMAATASLAAAIFRGGTRASDRMTALATAPDLRLLAALGLDPDRLVAKLPPALRHTLLLAIEGVSGLPQASVATLPGADLRTLVRRRIQEDYVTGRVGDVCGWRLSHMEIHCLGTAVRHYRHHGQQHA